MLAAGIKTPVPLEELESHLREDVENQMPPGLSAQQAFETTVRQIGQGDVLKNEFAKVGGTKEMQKRVKHAVLALAGVPHQHLDTNMNVLMLVLTLLEWRVSQWPRYRRAVFGILAVYVNVTVLAWITVLLVLSLVAADNLAHHAH